TKRDDNVRPQARFFVIDLFLFSSFSTECLVLLNSMIAEDKLCLSWVAPVLSTVGVPLEKFLSTEKCTFSTRCFVRKSRADQRAC
ncbi:hypothetical protein CSUI_006723, partial [Cystoisospora suis]